MLIVKLIFLQNDLYCQDLTSTQINHSTTTINNGKSQINISLYTPAGQINENAKSVILQNTLETLTPYLKLLISENNKISIITPRVGAGGEYTFKCGDHIIFFPWGQVNCAPVHLNSKGNQDILVFKNNNTSQNIIPAPIFEHASIIIEQSQNKNALRENLTIGCLPIASHEIGHFIFFASLPKFSSEISKQFQAFRKLMGDSELIFMKLKEDFKMGKINTEKFNDLISEAFDIFESKEDQLKEIFKTDLELLMILHLPHAELFSDLISVLKFKDLAIIENCLDSIQTPKERTKYRNFQGDISKFQSFSKAFSMSLKVHDLLYPTRCYLGEKLKLKKFEHFTSEDQFNFVISTLTAIHIHLDKLLMKLKPNEISILSFARNRNQLNYELIREFEKIFSLKSKI